MVKFRGEFTIKWKIKENDGIVHYIIINNVCLIYPHQWYQQAINNHPNSDGTWCAKKSTHCTKYWNQ